MVHQLFACSASANKPQVAELLDGLTVSLRAIDATRFSIWSYERSLFLGDRWDEVVQSEAMPDSSICLFAISRDALVSNYIQNIELPHFIDHPSKPILPVLMEELPRRADLRGMQATQIYGFDRPYSRCRRGGARTRFFNGLADEIVEVADRLDRFGSVAATPLEGTA